MFRLNSKVRGEKKVNSFAFFFPNQALSGLSDNHPHWGEQFTEFIDSNASFTWKHL